MAAPQMQYERRREAIFTDQHGREWNCTIDTHVKSQGPVGIPTLRDNTKGKGPFPPWIPEIMYWIWDVDRRRLSFNYDQMIADRTKDIEDWEHELRQLAIRQYKEMAKDAIMNPPTELLDAIGPRPAPIEVPMAAKAGNEWLIYGKGPKPEKAKAWFPDEEPRMMRGRANPKSTIDPFAEIEEVEDPFATGGKVEKIKAKAKV